VTHISRPIQIALAAAVLLIAVWFVALRNHSSSTESSGSGSSAPASSSPSQPSASQSASSSQGTPGGGTPASKGQIYKGSAPGVEGLSRAIHRAQGAVAQSQQNAQQLQKKSAEASGGTHAQGAQGQTQNSQAQSQSQTQQHQSRGQQTQQHRQTQQRQQAQPQSQAKSTNGVPAMQSVVEGNLAHGKLVAVLFWNPKGAVDQTVRRELSAASRDEHGKLAVHLAHSSEVGSFGSFTHTVQVYSTPTILLINKQGKTSSLTGLTDAFSIQQWIKEVKKAK